MKKAQQVWLETDVIDYVIDGCKWAEVRISYIVHVTCPHQGMSIGGAI